MEDKTRSTIYWIMFVLQVLLLGFSGYIIFPIPFLSDASIIGFVLLLPFALISTGLAIIITIIMLVKSKKHSNKPIFIVNLILMFIIIAIIAVFVYLLISGAFNG